MLQIQKCQYVLCGLRKRHSATSLIFSIGFYKSRARHPTFNFVKSLVLFTHIH